MQPWSIIYRIIRIFASGEHCLLLCSDNEVVSDEKCFQLQDNHISHSRLLLFVDPHGAVHCVVDPFSKGGTLREPKRDEFRPT